MAEPHLTVVEFFYHGFPQIFMDSEFQSVVIREICGRFLRRTENTTVDCSATDVVPSMLYAGLRAIRNEKISVIRARVITEQASSVS